MDNQNPGDNAVDSVSFAWWLGMLPFLAAAGYFIWQWSRHLGDVNLAYAAAAVIVGLVIAGSMAGAGEAAANAQSEGEAKQ